MDISANWNEVCQILDSKDQDTDHLLELLESGLEWFGKGGFTPDSLPVSRDNCTRIYASLLDRYCYC